MLTIHICLHMRHLHKPCVKRPSLSNMGFQEEISFQVLVLVPQQRQHPLADLHFLVKMLNQTARNEFSASAQHLPAARPAAILESRKTKHIKMNEKCSVYAWREFRSNSDPHHSPVVTAFMQGEESRFFLLPPQDYSKSLFGEPPTWWKE